MDGHPAGALMGGGGQNPAYRPTRHTQPCECTLKCPLACGFVLSVGTRW